MSLKENLKAYISFLLMGWGGVIILDGIYSPFSKQTGDLFFITLGFVILVFGILLAKLWKIQNPFKKKK